MTAEDKLELVSVRLTKRDIADLKKLAVLDRRKLSEYVRIVIEDFLKTSRKK